MCQPATKRIVLAFLIYFISNLNSLMKEIVPKRDLQGELATAFDLAAFRLSMIAPVKKSVNHSSTVASMRETG